jgi:hypothetical protein
VGGEALVGGLPVKLDEPSHRATSSGRDRTDRKRVGIFFLRFVLAGRCHRAVWRIERLKLVDRTVEEAWDRDFRSSGDAQRFPYKFSQICDIIFFTERIILYF